MFTTLTLLTALISVMFVGSIISSIAALHQEAKEMDELNRRSKVF
ncbi:hypothetical protein NOF55_11080 [Rhizobiaceae bacterium BDR2-2]|uniref:Uncharacterized protein n=1 Tax=Ectorhizobium quercum TaxID=2965071 RepID=A0AAE3N063_9HYPH|nr:hypothetical protein [Ectorhizobium quercum]MCX8997646.1 hypothetical protein [Ectorhizobium quercum]